MRNTFRCTQCGYGKNKAENELQTTQVYCGECEKMTVQNQRGYKQNISEDDEDDDY